MDIRWYPESGQQAARFRHSACEILGYHLDFRFEKPQHASAIYVLACLLVIRLVPGFYL
jgi:hypothetical protein